MSAASVCFDGGFDGVRDHKQPMIENTAHVDGDGARDTARRKEANLPFIAGRVRHRGCATLRTSTDRGPGCAQALNGKDRLSVAEDFDIAGIVIGEIDADFDAMPIAEIGRGNAAMSENAEPAATVELDRDDIGGGRAQALKTRER